MMATVKNGYYWCKVKNPRNSFAAPVQVDNGIVYVLLGSGAQFNVQPTYIPMAGF